MLFNSISFIYFLGIVFSLYQFTPKNLRSIFLLFSSYYFLSHTSIESAIILAFVGTVTFYSANFVTSVKYKKVFLSVLISFILLVLGYYKYRYFAEVGFSSPGEGELLFEKNRSLIIPLGISFYSFQMISYLIDVARGTVVQEKSFIKFLLYVSFFPQLIAGPIERAKDLIPSLPGQTNLSWREIAFALNLIAYGYIKKVVVADRIVPYLNEPFSNPEIFGRWSLLLAAFLYAIQIYCDFSGYTDIARGVAGLFGIRLSKNFDFPYFSTSFRGFWGRWHITLSSWFRDYVFFPLAFRQGFRSPLWAAVLVTFVLSGLWHGANWTFVIWGGVWGTLLICEEGFRRWFPIQEDKSYIQFAKGLITFSIIIFTWTIFRSHSPEHFMLFMRNIILPQSEATLRTLSFGLLDVWCITLFLVGYIVYYVLEFKGIWRSLCDRSGLISLLIMFFIQVQVVLLLGLFSGQSFIYFRF